MGNRIETIKSREKEIYSSPKHSTYNDLSESRDHRLYRHRKYNHVLEGK